MDEKTIRQITKDEILRYMNQKQFNYSKIPSHTHNGIDTVQISQKDLILNNKITTFLAVTTTSSTDEMNNMPNLSSISFYGFAADNAGGGAATKRIILNGRAEVGTCYFSNGLVLNKAPLNIIEASNAMYVDSTDLTKNRVSATNNAFCYATDDLGNVIVTVHVTYTNSKITFTTTLAAGWQLQGALIII